MIDMMERMDLANEMTRRINRRTRYRAAWKYESRNGAVIAEHTSMEPPLLTQLRVSATDRAEHGPDGLEHFDPDALDRLRAIDVRVAWWMRKCELERPHVDYANRITMHTRAVGRLLDVMGRRNARGVEFSMATLTREAAFIRGAIEYDIRALAALHTDSSTVAAIEFDMTKWHTWCEIFGGHTDRPLQPHVRCPDCGVYPGMGSGLRVRVVAAEGSGGVETTRVLSACCLACDATWPPSRVDDLPEEIDAADVARGLAEASDLMQNADGPTVPEADSAEP